MITDKQVIDALRGVMHPEIKRNLVELGMIKDVSVTDKKVTLTLALPFAEIPIKDDLVRMARKSRLRWRCLSRKSQSKTTWCAWSRGQSRS